MSAPWFKIAPDTWEMVTALLTTPWERQYVVADLEYWANKKRLGQDVLGRLELSRRWGWTDWKSRAILKEFDPYDRASGAHPDPILDTSGDHPDPPPENADNGEIPSGDHPGLIRDSSGQPLSRDPILKEKKKRRKKEGGPGDPALEILFGQICGRLSKSGHVKTTLNFESYEKRLANTVKFVGGAKTGPDNLLLVLDHWLEGPDDWHRKKFKTAGKLLGVLLKQAKTRDEYLPIAEEWHAMGRPTTKDQGFGVDQEAESEIDQWARLARTRGVRHGN